MSLKSYLRGILPLIVSLCSVLVIINIIFLVESLALSDLAYIDGLVLMIVGTGIGYHYYQMAKAYDELQHLIEEDKEIEESLSQNSKVIGIQLAQQITIYNSHKFQQKEKDYKEKLTNMNDYITQVVHDLKVNLAVCEMVIKRVPNEEQEKLCYEIEQMKFRVNQVLYVARANHYSEDLKAEHLQIEELLKKAIKENAEFFMNKDIELKVQIEPYEILSDKKWVLYMLTQILNNCSKYTSKGGRVEIISREDSKAYYLQIKDNGIGIAKEELSRIFDKGYTGSNGRLNTKATGMGLYYAKKMANELNIGIWAESRQGEYTQITLAFYKHSDYMEMREINAGA